MKKQKKGSSLHNRLKAYSMAAAGVLAVAPAAQATIHYSGQQNLVVNSTTTPVYVDLNSDGVKDFVFTYKSSSATGWLGIGARTSGGLGGTAFIGSTTGNYDANNLPVNYLIRNTLSAPRSWFINDTDEPLAGAYTTAGDFNYNGAHGYIGVRFLTSTGVKFGWIQWRTDTRATQGTIVDWAYEDSGAPIRAGDTGQVSAVPVPALNQWGLIILIGLLAGLSAKTLRKKEERS